MKKILHIEDNAENRLLVRRLLEQQGFTVIERVDGLSAVQAAKDERPDLVLMDINLPGIDGHHATTLIRGIRGLERIPIVAITSNVLPGAREEAIVAGCDGYIGKPIDVDTFVPTIAEFIGGRHEDIAPDIKADYLVKYSRKLAEALETHTYARKFLEGVILQNPLSTLITDTQGVCLMHNGAFVRVFNRYSPGGLVGVYNVLEDPALDQPNHRAVLRRLYEGRERVEFMARFEVPGRGDRTMKVFGFPILDERGELRNAVIQHEDVTEELRAIEEQHRLWDQLVQAQKMESIGELAGGVAEDFEHLLVGVLGSVELLLKNASEQDNTRQLLSLIKDSALRMSDLTKNLLGYARRGAARPEPLDAGAAVTEMLPFLRRLAGPRVDLSISVRPGLPLILADRGQLHQLVMNVVMNAVEATPGTGGVTIAVEGPVEGSGSSPGESRPAYVLLRVRDSGSGMSEEVRNRMFDPFFSTKEPGRGFGMAAALGIVTHHSGLIRVDSSPGEGTTVDVLWPIARETVHGRGGGTDLAPAGGETVLVVEGDESLAHSARETLEGHGYRVLSAPGPVEAIEAVRQNSQVRLAIVAEGFLSAGGESLRMLMGKVRPGLPVLAAFGPGGGRSENRGGEEGTSGFVERPYDREGLLKTVGGLLRSGNGGRGGSVSSN